MVFSRHAIQNSCGGYALSLDIGATHYSLDIGADADLAMEVLADEVRDGGDIQGIPWNEMNETREELREKRIKSYEENEDSETDEEDEDGETDEKEDEDGETDGEADAKRDDQDDLSINRSKTDEKKDEDGETDAKENEDGETDEKEDEDGETDAKREDQDDFLIIPTDEKEDEDGETDEKEDEDNSDEEEIADHETEEEGRSISEDEDVETDGKEYEDDSDEEETIYHKAEVETDKEEETDDHKAEQQVIIIWDIEADRMSKSDSDDGDEEDYDDMTEIQRVEKIGEFFEFFFNTRRIQPVKTHGQLSDLVWAARDEVYILSQPSIVSSWSPTNRQVTEVVRSATFNEPAPIITTFTVNETMWVGGGFNGELMWKVLNREGVDYFEKITDAEDAIITSIQLHDRTRRCIVSNNDHCISMYDTDNFRFQKSITVPFPVNAASLAPDSDMLLVGGDNIVGFLGDVTGQGKIANILFEGWCHAVAWHPAGQVFATCTEDEKCQLWDVRNTRHPFKDLKMLWKKATSVQFSADGELLVVGAADFVNIYSRNDSYTTRQQIDFFGGLSGISLSPDDNSLFIGITDSKHLLSSLMEYHRLH